MKPKIGWIKMASRRYGGVIYGELARESLARDFEVELINVGARHFKRGYLKAPELFLNLVKLKGKKDLWVREDLYPLITLPFDKTQGKNLALIYHIDSSQSPFFPRLLDSLMEKIARGHLRKVDGIVSIAEYWKNHFLNKGYKNIYKISPSFDLNDFNVSEKEADDFKKEFGLEGKPIIYIGNCQKAKGVVDAYQSLKDLNVHLVTSGEKMVEIPAKNLNLDYRGYLKLLKAATIAVTMSKWQEGWSMTTHEAMLLRTPVIGSGKGGMKELLEGGKQIICRNFSDLKKEVEGLLKNPAKMKQMGESGFNFGQNFTRDKFRQDWINVVKSII